VFLHLFFHLTVNLCSSFSCLPHEYSKTHTLRSLQLHLERLTCWLNDSKPQRLQGSWSLQFSEKAIDIVLPTNGLFTGSSFVKSQHRRPNSMNHRCYQDVANEYYLLPELDLFATTLAKQVPTPAKVQWNIRTVCSVLSMKPLVLHPKIGFAITFSGTKCTKHNTCLPHTYFEKVPKHWLVRDNSQCSVIWSLFTGRHLDTCHEISWPWYFQT